MKKVNELFETLSVFDDTVVKAVFAKIYGLTASPDDDPIMGVESLVDAIADKQHFYNCYEALLPLLKPLQSRYGHAVIVDNVCKRYGLCQPSQANPFTEEMLRMKYNPDAEGFDGTGKGSAQDIDYAFENSLTEFGLKLRQEVLEDASEEAKQRLNYLNYDPIVIADASKQTANEWQEARRIGGSSLSALTGNSKFSNAYTEYHKLKGTEELVEEKEEDQRYQQYIFDFGHQAEKFIAQAIEALPSMQEFRGCKVLVDTRIFSFEDREDYFSVNLDGILQWPDGHYSVAEFKAPMRWKQSEFENGNIPAQYMDQMQGQMLVTNLDDAYLFAFFSRDEVTASRAIRDLDYQVELLDLVDDFWFNNVCADIEPANVGPSEVVLKSNRKYVGKAPKKSSVVDAVDIDPRHLDALREADELTARRQMLDKESRNLKEQVENLLAPIVAEFGLKTEGILQQGKDVFILDFEEKEGSEKLNKDGMTRLKRDEPSLYDQLKPYLTRTGDGRKIKLTRRIIS